MWRCRPSVLCAAAWAMLSVVVVRRRLRQHGVHAVCPRPPGLPRSAGSGVQAVLTRLSPTCIERALISQAWLLSHGEPRDVIVGVPTEGMGEHSAHAWIAGSEPASEARYVEILRLAAGAPARPPEKHSTKPPEKHRIQDNGSD